jgi:KDO2-lipid IV(A) lauroyltransferase
MRGMAVLWFLRLCALLPLRVAHSLGALIGMTLAWYPNSVRLISRINLGLCFPDLDARRRERLLRDSLKQLGRTATELGALWFWPAERAQRLMAEVSGMESVRAALAQGKGVIIASPHLGAWEMAGLYISSQMTMTSLYRPPRMQALDATMRAARERLGAKLVPTSSQGVRDLYHALGRGEAVGILPDQEPDEGGVFAPLFGVPAKTMVLLSRLAMKTGAPVFFTYAERLPRGRGFHLRFFPAPADVNAESLENSVAAVNKMVEHCVRTNPSQYQWSYKRFRSMPDGKRRNYKREPG